jgi:hypothetical protein
MKKLFDSTDGPRCIHCGTPNPDHGPVCGNCGENPFSVPDGETLLFNPRLIFRGRTRVVEA